ncbi:hypothetical protein [Streptomyces chromofuscus]|uniref:hypothetical protein n=1 Tax=Streptomyces chromofuscus TaxID=42881 RepID=UPI0019CBA416|nr:hypothetical protein [Streptomyces chromofuscus]GGT02528.1 hypothetical protein GCM10010254_23500 [Streptomyces chromofuscus]
MVASSVTLPRPPPRRTSRVFDDPGSAAFEIATDIGGDLFSPVFLAGVAQFASGIAAQASTSRLPYAMGRDGALPRKVFARVHERYRTPAVNICSQVRSG